VCHLGRHSQLPGDVLRCACVAQVSPESMFMVAELCHGGSLRDVVRDQMVSFSRVGLCCRPLLSPAFLWRHAAKRKSSPESVFVDCIQHGVCIRSCWEAFGMLPAMRSLVVQVVYTYADALRWSVSIAEGLAYLHKQRPMIIHRDVKLDNVLLQGRPRLGAPFSNRPDARHGRRHIPAAGHDFMLRHLRRPAAASITAALRLQGMRTQGDGRCCTTLMGHSVQALLPILPIPTPAGTEKQWDAKLTDFGLHATVEALDTSSMTQSVCAA
jgi:serine/threonine protein kinase